MGYIPANPVIDLPSLLDGRRLPFPPPGIFSVARHALLSYLRHLGARSILVPDYMCHEVTHTLREAGHKVSFYSLDENFDVLPHPHQADAMLLAHFYGRMSRNLKHAAEVCALSGTALIEDCVHLPFPFHPDASFLSDARLFTLRKTYPVPYGAAITLKEGQERFASSVQTRYSESSAELLAWGAKQLAKKGLQWTGLGYKTEYRDLSADPIKPFNFVRSGFGRLLSMKNLEDAVARRRENYRTYLEHAEAFAPWGKILEFDLNRDVPYMFVLTLRTPLLALDAVKSLMKRSIPAAVGLALDPEVLKALPPDHRYHRVLALPIHQDIRPRQIRFIAQAFRELHG